MIILLRAVINHGHNVGIVVFIIVVESIEKDGETVPHVRRPKHGTFHAFVLREPEGLTNNALLYQNN